MYSAPARGLGQPRPDQSPSQILPGMSPRCAAAEKSPGMMAPRRWHQLLLASAEGAVRRPAPRSPVQSRLLLTNPATRCCTPQGFRSHSRGGWKCKVEAAAGLVSCEGPPPGSRAVVISCVLTWRAARGASGVSFRGLSPRFVGGRLCPVSSRGRPSVRHVSVSPSPVLANTPVIVAPAHPGDLFLT